MRKLAIMAVLAFAMACHGAYAAELQPFTRCHDMSSQSELLECMQPKNLIATPAEILAIYNAWDATILGTGRLDTYTEFLQVLASPYMKIEKCNWKKGQVTMYGVKAKGGTKGLSRGCEPHEHVLVFAPPMSPVQTPHGREYIREPGAGTDVLSMHCGNLVDDKRQKQSSNAVMDP